MIFKKGFLSPSSLGLEKAAVKGRLTSPARNKARLRVIAAAININTSVEGDEFKKGFLSPSSLGLEKAAVKGRLSSPARI